MANSYVTASEIKAAMPDGFGRSVVKYDQLLGQLAQRVSRAIDRRCKRVFYPTLETRVFDGPQAGDRQEMRWGLRVGDLIEIVSVEASINGGSTYEAVAATDYVATCGADYNAAGSFDVLSMDHNGTWRSWPRGKKAARINGWWGYTDDREGCWEDSGVTLAGNYSANGASLSAADASGLAAGMLARVDDEVFEVLGVVDGGTSADSVSVMGARNGTSAAGHSTGEAVLVWRAPEPVRMAALIQCARQLERGFQGFGDARATPEIGQLMYLAAMDPEAAALIETYIRMAL